jgi:hypothetical protein
MLQAHLGRSGAGDRIADPWGPGAPYGAGAGWPARVDTFLDGVAGPGEVDRWVHLLYQPTVSEGACS